MIISKNNEIVPNSEWESDVQLLLTEEDKRAADITADVDVVASTADAAVIWTQRVFYSL